MSEFSNKNQLIDEMLVAIHASLNYLQRRGGAFYNLKSGTYQGEIQNNHLYEFSTDYLEDIPDDVDIEIRVNTSTYEGKIYSIDSLEKNLKVSLHDYIGNDIPEARLVISNGFLLKLLVDRLTEVRNNKIHLSELASKILFPQTAYVGDREVRVNTDEFDEYKIDAIRHALGSEVSYIWGPPGTGKTMILSKVIEQLLLENQSILLLSHTNIATDRVLKSSLSNSHFDLTSPENIGSIIRLGKYPSEEIKDLLEYLDLPQVLKKKLTPLQNEINKLEWKILGLQNEEVFITKQLKIHDEIDKTTNLLQSVKQQIHENEVLFNESRTKLIYFRGEIENIDQRILNFQQSNFFGKLFSGANLDTLVTNKVELIKSRENLEYKQRKFIEKISELNTQALNLDFFLKITKRPSSPQSELEAELEKLEKNITQLKEETHALRGKAQEIEATLIGQAKMIVSTLSNAYVSKPLLSRSYDCVIVDEVSMAPIPALFFAAGLAKKKVILVGDFCQLPPIFQYGVAKDDDRSEQELQTERLLVEKWLRQDIFEHSGTETVVRSGGNAPWLKQLKRQYRMHPDIANVVNYITYSQFGNNYTLDSAENTHNKGLEFIEREPIPGARVAVINTNLSKTREFRAKQGSYYNLYSAIVNMSVAAKALTSGYKKIAIITPFRAQANLLQQMIKDRNWEGKVSADTVHRFQGEERDFIIFDLTTSFPTILTDDGASGGNDEKLINVALSRAESKCVLVCNVEEVEAEHSESSPILKFIHWCKQNNYPVVESNSLLENDAFTTEKEWLTKVKGLNSIDDIFKESEVADHTDFYQKFCRDILSAEKEIIIDSPFITKDRSDYLIPFFEHAMRGGVKIYIITRLPDDHNGAMKDNSLEVMSDFERRGIIVLPFKGLPHRKLAIIDRKIMWLGSLNILSHRNSQEIMFRTTGKTTCDQLLSLLKFDKNIGVMGEKSKLKRCEFCNKPGAWYWTEGGKFGQWTLCLIGGHKPGKPPVIEEKFEVRKNGVSAGSEFAKQCSLHGSPICPHHNIEMVLKNGKYGKFWGCPEYPRCKITKEIYDN